MCSLFSFIRSYINSNFLIELLDFAYINDAVNHSKNNSKSTHTYSRIPTPSKSSRSAALFHLRLYCSCNTNSKENSTSSVLLPQSWKQHHPDGHSEVGHIRRVAIGKLKSISNGITRTEQKARIPYNCLAGIVAAMTLPRQKASIATAMIYTFFTLPSENILVRAASKPALQVVFLLPNTWIRLLASCSCFILLKIW